MLLYARKSVSRSSALLRGPFRKRSTFFIRRCFGGRAQKQKKLESKHGKRKLGRQKLVTTSLYAMAEVIFHVSPFRRFSVIFLDRATWHVLQQEELSNMHN